LHFGAASPFAVFGPISFTDGEIDVRAFTEREHEPAMPLTLGPVAIGTHARFFRNGSAFTVPSAGTAGRNSKPGSGDAGWIDLGVIGDAGINPQVEEIEVWAPSPGRKVLHDVIHTKGQTTIKLTLQEFGPFVLELVERSAALDGASTTFAPLAALNKKGWLEVKHYSQGDDTVVSESYYYVQLKVAGEVPLGDGLVAVQIEARVLNSSVDGGSVGPAP
jgi:hypothetical protein